MPGEKNEGATRVADQRAGGPYGLHSRSLRTASVSMGIEVEGPTKRHCDKAGRDGPGPHEHPHGGEPLGEVAVDVQIPGDIGVREAHLARLPQQPP